MEEKLKLNIAICDDEPAILEQLETICRQILEPAYDLCLCCSTRPEEILGAHMAVQLALLDVQLQRSSGIALAQRLLLDNPACRIIFVSAHTSVVSDVYDVPHYCMILKDQIPAQLPKFLHRAADEVAQEAGKSLQVWVHKKTVNMMLSDIVFMERRGHVTTIVLRSGEKIAVRDKLSELLERIPSPYFCRCHISYVANLTQVQEVDGHYLKMTTGDQLPVSNSYEEETWKTYSRYLRRGF